MLHNESTQAMTTIRELGPFSPDISVVVRQLRQDLKDDWYPDSLGYEDMLNDDVAAKLLEGCFEDNHGQYIPDERLELNIPKKKFVLRYSLEMSLKDRLYYQALITSLIPHFDVLLPQNVLNHRYALGGGRKRRSLFKDPVSQWKLFYGYVAQETKAKPVIVITDIQNYYENINVDKLIEVLETNVQHVVADARVKAMLRRVIAELQRCLRKWCYQPSHGLPQNRDASSFLANIAMLEVDKAMLREKYAYFRYMDDIRIAVQDRYEARTALQFLASELRRHGLNLNSAKTSICEPGTNDHDQALGKSDRRLTQIENMWKSKSVQVIRRSFAPLSRLATDLISKGETQDRAFRFCVRRFEALALCADLGVPKSFFDPLIEICLRELDVQPFSSDQLVRFLKAAPASAEQLAQVAALVSNHKQAVYDWQNYLLWQLLVYKSYSSAELLEVARVRASKTSRPADRAGAILFVGAMGSKTDRLMIAEMFHSCDNQLVQRSALIAIHELDFQSGVEQYVAPHVYPSLVGTYNRLRNSFRGQYFRPLPPESASSIYAVMSAYD